MKMPAKCVFEPGLDPSIRYAFEDAVCESLGMVNPNFWEIMDDFGYIQAAKYDWDKEQYVLTRQDIQEAADDLGLEFDALHYEPAR